MSLLLGAVVLAAAAMPAHGLPSQTENDPPNDPGFDKQWGVEAIGAIAAWQVATGEDVTIAIVDSGADLDHVDLADNIVGHAECVDTGGDPALCAAGTEDGLDDNGHGTHVAGIAAAARGNGQGVVGVAPDADLLIVKVLREECDIVGCEAAGTAADVAAGILWAVDQGADVINLSLGSTSQAIFGPAFTNALNDAWRNGAIPVVAAGNDFVLGSGFTSQPAIVVSALGRDLTEASYSNGVGQARWAIAAPGGESDSSETCGDNPLGVISTFWVDGEPDAYACLAGTSMAAPHVAGAAAVLRSLGLSPQETVDRLLGTARDLGPAGRDSIYGAGALDLAAAVAGLGSTTTTTSSTVPGTAPTSVTTPGPEPEPTTPTTPEQPTTSRPPTSLAPPTTGPPEVVELPPPGEGGDGEDIGTGTGAGTVTAGTPVDDGSDLPAGPVTAAALLAVAVGVASGWRLVEGASWARRTPK